MTPVRSIVIRPSAAAEKVLRTNVLSKSLSGVKDQLSKIRGSSVSG